MTTSTRIVKYKPQVTKLNPVSCKTSEKNNEPILRKGVTCFLKYDFLIYVGP